MNASGETANSPATPEERIRALCTAGSLPFRDMHLHTRAMARAVQPLTMGDKEICTDTILAELVIYPSSDQMTRETETLTLKKAAFGEFEPSMTPIPKYCFPGKTGPECVLIHSIPRFTLDDLLTRAERTYPAPYPCDKIRFYIDWFTAVLTRLRSDESSGRLKFLKMLLRLPKYLFPQPPHIPQSQRRTLAGHLLRIVRQHHRKSIYHDCITEKTVFLTSPYQPLFLANYAGVVAPALADHLPGELIDETASGRYGPHFRDVYSLALICYHLCTGICLDGRLFGCGSPRPTGIVIREIARDSKWAFSFKSLPEIRHTFASAFLTIRRIAGRLPLIFSTAQFSAWRNLNKATGGIWRHLPVIGPLCDIYAPTGTAQALRYILDRHWLPVYHSLRGGKDTAASGHGPDLSLLTAVFRTGPSISYPCYSDLYTALTKENDSRRSAFRTMMESEKASSRWRRVLRHPPLLPAVIPAAVLVTILFYGIVIRPRTSGNVPVNTTAQSGATVSTLSGTGRKTATVPTGAGPIDSGRTETPEIPPKDSPVDGSRYTMDTVPVNGSGPARPFQSKRNRKPPAPAKKPEKKATSPSGISRGMLNPALGFKDVFIVTGVRDSSNPGELSFPVSAGKQAPLLGKLAEPRESLHIVHRTSSGFSRIHSIYLCRSDKCDTSAYYYRAKGGGTGKPAFVRTGDAVSGNRDELQRFVQLRMSLIRK